MANRRDFLKGIGLGAAALALPPWLAPARLGGAEAETALPGLTVSPDGVLLKGGRPWRGIGVNYFDAFLRTFAKPDDTSYEAGFTALADAKIPFARFACCGFWPVQAKAYRADKDAYFGRLDAVVKAAERRGVGLVPSLFWYMSTVPDLVGESCDQWGNPGSKTIVYMREYAREVVTRYKNSPAIWGWEFGNEYALQADLPNAAEHRPPTHPTLGTPALRSARDELTHDMVRTAFLEFAREVRKYDPQRFVTTGNSIPRPSDWHQMHEHNWTKDSPAEYAPVLTGDTPDPMNVISVHCYGDALARLPLTMEIAVRARKPLFVGEFGVADKPDTPAAENEKPFGEMLRTIVQLKVPMAALWVYDLSSQLGFTVTATNARSWQLKAISEANGLIRADLVRESAARP
jgi:hypothetical protein